jgi:hypothetical protein
LWGATLLLFIGFALAFEGHGLALDWPILSGSLILAAEQPAAAALTALGDCNRCGHLRQRPKLTVRLLQMCLPRRQNPSHN